MAVYQVAYDLNKPNQSYGKLEKLLMSYDGYIHSQESVWFVHSAKSAAQVRDHLRQAIDGNDKLLVTKVTAGAAINDSRTIKWLNDHL